MSEESTNPYSEIETLKKEGNDLYVKNDYELAIQKYNEALDLIINLNINDDKTLLKLKSVLLSNRAACRLELNDTTGALSDSIAAVDSDQTNMKAYYRQSQAVLKINENNIKDNYAIWKKASLNCESSSLLTKYYKEAYFTWIKNGHRSDPISDNNDLYDRYTLLSNSKAR